MLGARRLGAQSDACKAERKKRRPQGLRAERRDKPALFKRNAKCEAGGRAGGSEKRFLQAGAGSPRGEKDRTRGL